MLDLLIISHIAEKLLKELSLTMKFAGASSAFALWGLFIVVGSSFRSGALGVVAMNSTGSMPSVYPGGSPVWAPNGAPSRRPRRPVVWDSDEEEEDIEEVVPKAAPKKGDDEDNEEDTDVDMAGEGGGAVPVVAVAGVVAGTVPAAAMPGGAAVPAAVVPAAAAGVVAGGAPAGVAAAAALQADDSDEEDLGRPRRVPMASPRACRPVKRRRSIAAEESAFLNVMEKVLSTEKGSMHLGVLRGLRVSGSTFTSAFEQKAMEMEITRLRGRAEERRDEWLGKEQERFVKYYMKQGLSRVAAILLWGPVSSRLRALRDGEIDEDLEELKERMMEAFRDGGCSGDDDMGSDGPGDGAGGGTGRGDGPGGGAAGGVCA